MGKVLARKVQGPEFGSPASVISLLRVRHGWLPGHRWSASLAQLVHPGFSGRHCIKTTKQNSNTKLESTRGRHKANLLPPCGQRPVHARVNAHMHPTHAQNRN